MSQFCDIERFLETKHKELYDAIKSCCVIQELRPNIRRNYGVTLLLPKPAVYKKLKSDRVNDDIFSKICSLIVPYYFESLSDIANFDKVYEGLEFVNTQGFKLSASKDGQKVLLKADNNTFELHKEKVEFVGKVQGKHNLQVKENYKLSVYSYDEDNFPISSEEGKFVPPLISKFYTKEKKKGKGETVMPESNQTRTKEIMELLNKNADEQYTYGCKYAASLLSFLEFDNKCYEYALFIQLDPISTCIALLQKYKNDEVMTDADVDRWMSKKHELMKKTRPEDFAACYKMCCEKIGDGPVDTILELKNVSRDNETENYKLCLNKTIRYYKQFMDKLSELYGDQITKYCKTPERKLKIDYCISFKVTSVLCNQEKSCCLWKSCGCLGDTCNEVNQDKQLENNLETDYDRLRIGLQSMRLKNFINSNCYLFIPTSFKEGGCYGGDEGGCTLGQGERLEELV